jgi:hypothetical protein
VRVPVEKALILPVLRRVFFESQFFSREWIAFYQNDGFL